ncbi:hypothetical protein L1987_20443 [Smallanthus sonchifolius]|uniref:Uncharacterized protein n=1 Tax=Smallanthus sonchifolius TaxID=185202 RepID=A0ACB9ITJ5_9ASTR|nr:hypothetical protein L1987_20443 [Smallanthus sonchifolius]
MGSGGRISESSDQTISYLAWPVYWFSQASILTGLWVIGHEWGHHVFSEYHGLVILLDSSSILLSLPHISHGNTAIKVTMPTQTHSIMTKFTFQNQRDSTEWNWIKGALSTVDRDFGFLNRVFHDVTHTHVLHHLISYIPHYHAIKPVLGDYYKIDRTPIFKAMLREAKECIYMEPDEDTKHQGCPENKVYKLYLIEPNIMCIL